MCPQPSGGPRSFGGGKKHDLKKCFPGINSFFHPFKPVMKKLAMAGKGSGNWVLLRFASPTFFWLSDPKV